MSALVLIATTICLFILPSNIKALCTSPQLTVNRVLETRGPKDGHIMTFGLQTGSRAYIESRVGSHNLASYFRIQTVGASRSTVYLTKPLNMDFIRDVRRSPKGELTITITLVCRRVQQNSSINRFNFYIIIVPMDNYPPEFRPNIVFNVNEATRIGWYVANIRARVVDRDFPDFTKITRFLTHPNPTSKADGYRTFQISDHGDITLSKALDFDEGNRIYQLKVSATNNLNQTANGVVTLNVINANDNPPKFVFPGCEQTCSKTHYEINQHWVSTSDQIRAIDLDNDTISYSITRVSPGIVKDLVRIDTQTGKLWLSANAQGLSLIVLIVQAISIPKVPNANSLSKYPDRALAIVVVYPHGHPISTQRLSNGAQCLPKWLVCLAYLSVIGVSSRGWYEQQ